MELKHINFIGKYRVHEILFGKYKIKSYVFGSGEKIVFSLPSFPHSGLYYLWFISHYDLEKVKVITFDLPGWIGASENVFCDEKFSLDKYIQVANSVLDFYQIKKYSLIGYSFGGSLAIRLAADHLNRIDKLVLVSAFVDGKLSVGSRNNRLIKFLYSLKWGWCMKVYVYLTFRKYEKVLLSEGLIESGVNFYERLISKCDGTLLLQSIYTLFNTDWTVYLRKIKGFTNILVVSSKNEDEYMRVQSRHIRRELEHERTMFIHGSHEDFLLKPNTEIIKAVVDFVTKE